jgi:hypothetical protein
VHQAGSTQRRETITCHAKRAARLVREVGYGLAMPEEVGLLQVDEVRDRP